MKVMLINGPNLNMLGHRDPVHYGTTDYRTLVSMTRKKARSLGMKLLVRQSNCEGDLVDFIQEAGRKCEGLIVNPGAYSHYSYAILDALTDAGIPSVEVHLSDVSNREDFRKNLITAQACRKVISGKGVDGYLEGLEYLQGEINATAD